ncbi:MAG TPA: hypothetical protein VI915_06160 [Thermoplasmata archaeon]|nr:hypothetical protein [Thermoplasmata archaeon]
MLARGEEGPPVGIGIHGGVLDHPTRRRIYDHLLVRPGSHFRDIVRVLRIGYGTTLHHLNVLIDEQFIRTEKGNGRRRYYPIGQRCSPRLNELFERYWSYRDLRVRVLHAVRHLGSAGPTNVGRALGVSRQLAAYHLDRLVEMGHVKKEGRRYRAA